ncbi:MAG: redoxin [Lutibacter sp.]|nr:MAG: redoxin [Lutibacter sp.]
MKKYIKLVIVVVLISTIGFLGYSITKKINDKAEVAKRIKSIPKFSFLTLEGKVFTSKNLAKDTYKLFVYFNSECEYCQTEALQISKNLEEFKDTQLIFVSFEPVKSIKQFSINFNLQDKKKVLFLQDKKVEFAEIFDAKSIPFMLLYAKNNQLIKIYKGATKVERILKLLY